MSAVARLLAKVREAGVHLEVRDGDLKVKAAAGVLTPERLATIRKHKGALLEALKAEAQAVPQTVAPAAEVVEIARATRGPCTYCAEPVGWSDGLRNWFGQLVHHGCAGRWKGATQSPPTASQWCSSRRCGSARARAGTPTTAREGETVPTA